MSTMLGAFACRSDVNEMMGSWIGERSLKEYPAIDTSFSDERKRIRFERKQVMAKRKHEAVKKADRIRPIESVACCLDISPADVGRRREKAGNAALKALKCDERE